MRTTPSEVAPLVLHGRHLNEVSVSTVAELTAAVGNSAVDKILVAAGTHSFTADMCDEAQLHQGIAHRTGNLSLSLSLSLSLTPYPNLS